MSVERESECDEKRWGMEVSGGCGVQRGNGMG